MNALARCFFPVSAFVLALAAFAAVATGSPAEAGADFVVSKDAGIGSDGTAQDKDSYQVRVGELHAPGGEAYIIPLRIPRLPPGEQFATAHVRVQLGGMTNEGGLANADLYCLGVRDSSTALATDYYQGAKPDSRATLIQANFLTPSSKVRTDPATGPFVDSSAQGDAALLKYLNDACAKPEAARKYLLLRLSYDADTIPNGNNAYLVLSTGAKGDDEPPQISYTLTARK